MSPGERMDAPRVATAEWLAVSHVEVGGGDKHILYFLSHTGEILDFAERDTLEQILAHAAESLASRNLLWNTANSDVPEATHIPIQLLKQE